MDGLINTATTTFETTTGFSLASVIDWMGDNLAKLFLGMGLGVLDGLKVWIVALIAITAIIYFAFRFIRFYRS